jgi:hypothetical protein
MHVFVSFCRHNFVVICAFTPSYLLYMDLFKVTYVNNKPFSCSLVMGKSLNGKYTYEYLNQTLIYAFINATDEEQAMEMAAELVVKVQRLVIA